MLGALAQIRAAERRPVLAAFATLLCFTAGHAMLETARDALFLARLSPAQLPWVYLAIAAGSLVLALFAERRARTSGYRLAAWLGLASASLVALQLTIVDAGPWALYLLYVWSGVVATLVLTRFWLLLGGQFTLTQAKRLYGPIGAGAVLGAIIGSGLARLVTEWGSPVHLLSGAATLFAVSAMGPLLLERPGTVADEAGREHEPVSHRALLESSYARRVGVLVWSSTLALTLSDFLFKSTVAAHVPAAELGEFFASAYFAFNVLSLFVQLALVQPLVRVAGVSGALALLPSLLVGGGIGMLLTGGLTAALLLKGADGALRYSLHRTVLELLFVPMGERLRSSARTLIDVVGQRGGQALASLLILAAFAFGIRAEFFAALLVLVAGLWALTAYNLRAHYIDLFRQTLRESAAHPQVRFPRLDLGSLESVIAALNSQNDAEVCAALQILSDKGRARLIPALILYHPSPEVVMNALEILDKSGRTDFIPITERLLESGEPQVRAAVLRLRNARAIDVDCLRRFIGQDCPIVTATALVILTGAGLASDAERERLRSIAATGSTEAKSALAHAIAHRSAAESGQFEDLLMTLASDSDTGVRKSAVAAMAVAPSARYLEPLMRMLPKRELRNDARKTLVALGDTALEYVASALTDAGRPLPQRRHIPRTLMRFRGQRVADLLLHQLPVESDGVVRYKILRALAQLHKEQPELVIDAGILNRAIAMTIERTYQLVEWRAVLERGSAAAPETKTEAQSLLVRLLYDKEVQAIDRLFLMLGLLFPEEDIATVWRALRSSSASVRSSSRELLENLLEPALRGPVLGLTDEGSSEIRLAQAGRFRPNSTIDYESVLQELLETPSQAIRSLAVYHAAEQGFSRLRPRIERLAEPQHGLLSGVARTALEWLGELKRPDLALET